MITLVGRQIINVKKLKSLKPVFPNAETLFLHVGMEKKRCEENPDATPQPLEIKVESDTFDQIVKELKSKSNPKHVPLNTVYVFNSVTSTVPLIKFSRM